MGATPNAMANMRCCVKKYAPSVKAYLIIPLIGSLFADFINSLVLHFSSIYYNRRNGVSMFKFRKKREKGHEYNLTYDNHCGSGDPYT